MQGFRTDYALVTPARDEAERIGSVLNAVVAQEHKPRKWVIVSDGSTDGTDDIVTKYAANYPFIQLVRRDSADRSDFASKVHAFNQGLANLGAAANAAFIGNLDADVTFAPDYFRRLIVIFEDHPRLGIAGGKVHDPDALNSRAANTYSVAGAVQLFRRQCFAEIGGIPALRLGGEDAAAQITARSRGWEVATVPLDVQHMRPTGHRHGGRLRVHYTRGLINDSLGYDPVFMVASAARRIRRSPAVIGALASLAGYAASAWRRTPHAVDALAVSHLRNEQRARLKSMVRRGA